MLSALVARPGDGPLFLAVAAALVLPAQQPTFRTAVERVVIDVQVVDDEGRPLDALTAADFEVRFDQHPRTVVSAQFVRVAESDTPAAGAPARAGDSTAGANATSRGGRDFILAVDESSFRTADVPAVMRATRAFVDQLAPGDRVGLYTYPASPRVFPLTPDHTSVAMELHRVVGTFQPPQSRFHLSPAEIMDIESGNTDLVKTIAKRECFPDPMSQFECTKSILADANQIAATYESLAATSTNAVRQLLAALNQDPSRKTVVLISGGLLASDLVGGRPDISRIVEMIAADAAAARANVYALHMDSRFLQAFSGGGGGSTRDAASVMRSVFRESSAFASGLERLAGAAGGALIHVEAGAEDRAFQRILRETSGYYLLSVEPLPDDRDGRLHYISVKTSAKGAEVRARRTVIVPAAR